jgi:hypothetical protein
MEKIRIVKRKSGTGYIWGILAALLIIGAIAWFVVDQDLIDQANLSADRNRIENDEYRTRDYYGHEQNRDREYRNFDQYQRGVETDHVQAYVSFVNRRIIPADRIDDQMTQNAVEHFEKALNEVSESTTDHRRENFDVDRDTVDTLGSADQRRNDQNRNADKQSLIEAGNKLVEIQQSEYPSLSEMGEAVKKSLNKIENKSTDASEDLKAFFVASSSLFQEIENERANDVSYNTNREEL